MKNTTQLQNLLPRLINPLTPPTAGAYTKPKKPIQLNPGAENPTPIPGSTGPQRPAPKREPAQTPTQTQHLVCPICKSSTTCKHIQAELEIIEADGTNETN